MTGAAISSATATATLNILAQPRTSGLAGAARDVSHSTNIVQAAHKFEAMAISQLLKPIFASAGQAAPPFGGGVVEKSFRPFLIDAIAKQMEARGGLGLAPMIEHALAADQASHAADVHHAPGTAPVSLSPTSSSHAQAEPGS